MSGKIKVLLVEDSENDAILIKRELTKGGFTPEIKRVETEKSMKEELNKLEWDIVIADYLLPQFNGLKALQLLRQSSHDIPFILLSGKIGEDTAVAAMKNGADDYIMKDNIKKLSPAVKRELEDYKNKREQKKAREEIENYHQQLEKINQQLKLEIDQKKEAEKKAIEAKEYMLNVINSTSQIIIAINNNNRITIWNTGAEKVTGYSKKDVFNRTISKIDLFNDIQEIEKAIQDISKGQKSELNNTVITTEYNSKKILRMKGYLLRGQNRKKIGILFIGDDITRDAKMHGKLVEGNSYFITGKNNDQSIDLFIDLVGLNHQGLLISRTNPEILKSLLPTSSDIKINLLSEEKLSGYQNIIDLNKLVKTIKDFCEANESTVILLDSIHYLLTRYSFNEFMMAIFKINEVIIKTKSMLFVRFDEEIVQNQQKAIIENELQPLPSQKIKGITLEDSVYDILKFIYEQNKNNALVPFKKVMSKFKISYSTAAKRLEGLEEKGLVFTKRQGKLRTIYISEKGKTLLHKRDVAE